MTIADYIASDLASRIRAGSGVPERLTLSSIAKLYDVSLTPVRAALDALVDERLVVKKANGRLALASGTAKPSAGKRRAPAPPTDWDATLGREVLLLSLRTRGEEFVREEAMAEKHGIGRSLLRSVFQRLAGGGLLEHVPRRGWRVPAFQQDEMNAYVDIRETLEVKALDLARPHLEADRLDEMIRGNGRAAVRRGEIDNALHAYFVACSGNRFIEAFFDSNGRYYHALFDYAALGAKVVAEMAGQHVEILEHARARHWAKARSALSHHIQCQRPVMEAMIANLDGAGE
ncbi:MAG: GntR family transcriptional regulator [Planctomycetota bacterium]